MPCVGAVQVRPQSPPDQSMSLVLRTRHSTAMDASSRKRIARLRSSFVAASTGAVAVSPVRPSFTVQGALSGA